VRWLLLIAVAFAGCRFDARGLPGPDASAADDRPRPGEGVADLRPDAALMDGARDRSPDHASPPLVPPPYLASQDGWGLRLPLVESGENLNGLWLSPAGQAWAVGDGGRILHSAAFGRDWRIVDSPTSEVLRAVSASSPADVWIVGENGTALHYNGKVLALVSLPTSEDLFAVHAFSPSDVWMVGAENTVLHFDGASWSAFASPASSSASLRAVWGASPGVVWVAGSGGTLLRYNGSVATKELTGTSYQLNAIWGPAANDIWAVGTYGTVLRFDGTAWKSVPSATGASLSAVHGTPAGEVRAVGASGTVMRYSAGGWQLEPLPDTTASLHAIAGSSPGHVLVTGASATLRRFDGSSWRKLALRVSTVLNGVWTGGGETWAVGNSGLVLRSSAGGWEVVPSPASLTDLNGIWGTSPSALWVVGSLGLVARWDGAAWSTSPSSTAASLNGIWGRSASDLYAVGASGTILHFDGVAWTKPALAPSTLASNYAVHGSAAAVYIGGSSSRVVSYLNGTWATTDLLENTSYRAVFCHANEAWLAGDGGKLAYTAGGSSFKVAATGTDLRGLFGLSPAQLWAVGKGGLIATLGPGLATTAQVSDTTADLAAIHGSSASDLWAVGQAGTILHHDDRLP
jgi:hypothetical protein